MAAIMASTTFGSCMRWASGGRLFKPLELRNDFQLSEVHKQSLEDWLTGSAVFDELHSHPSSGDQLYMMRETSDRNPSLPATQQSAGNASTRDRQPLSTYSSRAALNQRPSAATLRSDHTILVEWYGDQDPENPQNWTLWVKAMVYIQINLYTFGVYMSSSIFSPTQRDFMEHYNTSETVASLGLALYVLGYGCGPLLFSPLSEVPSIGRNPPYIISLSIYVLLCIPTALIDNLPGFMVLRFLQGFFGSPCLATGGASLADVTSLINLSYGLFAWAVASLAAPALAPTIASFSITEHDWRWPMWEILWTTGPCLVLLFFLPETSASTILLRRARRLRVRTGCPAFKAQSEIQQKQLSISKLVHGALLMPWKINALDPAILFTTIYTALTYAIFYSFFEVFPFVYQDIYGMGRDHVALIFLTSIIATLAVLPLYFLFLHRVVSPPLKKGQMMHPEQRLIPALFGSLSLTSGLFIFAWTSRASIHWIVPTVGFFLVMAGIALVVQCLFTYIAITYPLYAASLFSMNGFMRSFFAFASVLWSAPLYRILGVARGTSLIGGLTVGCVIGIWTLYFIGPRLRKMSRFTYA